MTAQYNFETVAECCAKKSSEIRESCKISSCPVQSVAISERVRYHRWVVRSAVSSCVFIHLSTQIHPSRGVQTHAFRSSTVTLGRLCVCTSRSQVVPKVSFFHAVACSSTLGTKIAASRCGFVLEIVRAEIDRFSSSYTLFKHFP